MNNLAGNLLRFCVGKIATVADIEAMFDRARVDPRNNKFLKLTWWPQGETDQPPVDLCVVARPFGAKSSSSCAHFSLLQTAEDHADAFSFEVINCVKQCYVDDC